jgi:hypothetical protein
MTMSSRRFLLIVQTRLRYEMLLHALEVPYLVAGANSPQHQFDPIPISLSLN